MKFRMTCGWTWPAALALATAAQAATAQGNHDVAGTWTLVSSVTDRGGVRTEQFGAGAQGRLVLDPNGHFVIVWQSDSQDGDAYGTFGRRLGNDAPSNF